MRLIDADRLLSDRMKSTYYHLPNGDTAIPIIDIEHAPTIEERKKGKWDKVHWKAFRCSECKQLNEFLADYCPNCGADMRQ